MEDLQVLDYSTVEAGYRAVVLDHSEMIAFSVCLGVLFAVFNVIRSVRDDMEGQIDYAKVLRLLKENIKTFALILAAPIILLGIEEIFALIEKSYMGQLGSEPAGFKIALKKELDSMVLSDDLDIWSLKDWGIALWEVVQMLGTLIIKPFAVLIDQWSFGFALVYRFIYLGLLKMMSGVAIACYIYEPTRQYFTTFVKNLLICYLLIPGFLFVTVFVDAIRDTFFQADVQLGIILMAVFLKIMGYSAVHRLLQSSI